ncbi:MAG: pyruvate formate lyase family protein [Anaerolineales bacterium]
MLPDRIAESIETWFDKDYRATFFERIDYLVESEPLFANQPYAVRYGNTLGYILDRVTLVIQPGEKIIGSVKEVIPSAEQKEIVERLSSEWWGIDQSQIQEKALFYYSYGWIRRRPPWFFSLGHLALDWEGIITQGLGYFEAHARQVAGQPEMLDDPEKANFLQGAVLCYQALSRYIARHADQVRQEAAACNDPLRRAELLELGEICDHISHAPARSFREALQLIWFIVLPLMKVAGCGVFNLHRMDQYLLPYFRRDIENSTLTETEALELIIEFYNKNNEIMSPTDHMSQEIETTLFNLEVTYDDPNYLTLGGLLAEDRPGVNELSYLFVESAHRLKLRNPFVVVRYYPDIDPQFWRRVCDAMRDNATLVVYNDQTMIPALQSYGVDPEDVYNYGFYGCNDPNLPAQEGSLRQLWFNLLRPLELALHGGEYPLQPNGNKPVKGSQYSLQDRMIGLMTGPYYGTQTPPAEDIQDLDDLLDAYRLQVRYLLEDYRRAFEQDFKLELKYNAGRIRIEDCFLEGTVDHATTWNNGGTKYHKVTIQGSGLASVIDSLATVEQLVFRNGEMTLRELVEELKDNFAGSDQLQARLSRKMPKFGNDIEWVDQIGSQVVDIFCDEIARVNKPDYLYTFFPCISTDRDFTTMGQDVGATPDGRRAGQQISENQSPTQGADMTGLTALLNSVARLPFDRITGGPLNIRIHPSAVKGDNGLEMFAIALQTYFNKGGNVMSREQLLDAQQNPNKYKNLCVRVTGYSAYFVQMGKKAQDELINRTEKA